MKKSNVKIWGILSAAIMIKMLFLAAFLSYQIGFNGWAIMACMFVASLADNISRKCFRYAKGPRLYVVPITKDMVDEDGKIKQ